MAGQIKPITDEELVDRINHQVRLSVGYSDSRLARERLQMMDYYDGVRPRPFHRGDSRYVSTDCYDKCESMKATLLDTFTGNRQPVRFAPQGPEDVQLAREATAYCDYVLFRQNKGYEAISQVIHDGLLFRAGVAKVWWDERNKEEEVELQQPISEMQLDMIMSVADVVEFDGEEVAPGMFTGTFLVNRPEGQVRVLPLPPEEFLITPQAVSIDEAILCTHRLKMRRNELIERGYPKRLVMSLPDIDSFTIETQGERWTRHKATSDQIYRDIDPIQSVMSEITVYESYPYVDIEGRGQAELWKVTTCGQTLLDKERVERRPFIPFVPLPKSHAFYGSSYIRKVVPTQNARSILTRAIIDHTTTTTNPRWKVVTNTLTNPQELMENRLGGIVNVNRPDGVSPLDQPILNPFVFQTIELLDKDAEETTGITELAQGLDPNAVSKQNSADLISQMVSVSQQRQKIIARNFAEHFLRPLFIEIYQLVLENEDAQKVIEVAGSYQTIDPKQWRERKDVIVEFSLGYGEDQREIMKQMGLYQMMASPESGLGPLFGPTQRYNMMRRILETAGVKDHEAVLLPPEQLPPPQPSPQEQLQLAAAQKQLEIAERQTQVAEGRVMNEQARIQVQATDARDKLRQKELEARRRFGLDTRELEHEIYVDNEELRMAREVAPQERRAIVSPA